MALRDIAASEYRDDLCKEFSKTIKALLADHYDFYMAYHLMRRLEEELPRENGRPKNLIHTMKVVRLLPDIKKTYLRLC